MQQPTITYIYDALCGWCYGFSPVMSSFYASYVARAKFEVVSGGLFLGERIGPINEVAAYIKEGAYKEVETTTGVTFGDGFLKVLAGKKEMFMDSHLPAIAMAIIKEVAPDKVMPFAQQLLAAFYKDGINPAAIEAYLPYVKPLGLSEKDFLLKMKQDSYRMQAQKEFQYFQKLELGGFPSFIVTVGDQPFLIAKGYTTLEDLERRYKSVLAQSGTT